MYRLSWQPVDRGPLVRPGDFVILIPEDRDWLARLHLEPLYEDAVSGEVLASPNAPPADRRRVSVRIRQDYRYRRHGGGPPLTVKGWVKLNWLPKGADAVLVYQVANRLVAG